MTENPYRLTRDIRGIGFKTADAIAMKLGIEKTAMVRVRAGISYALTEANHEGHCGLPTEQLMPGSCSRSRRSSSAPRSISSCGRALWSPTRSVKRRVYFWLACIARSAPSPNG